MVWLCFERLPGHLHHSHRFTRAKACASVNRETANLDACVQILIPRDVVDVVAMMRKRLDVDRTLALLHIDGYLNQLKPQFPINVLS